MKKTIFLTIFLSLMIAVGAQTPDAEYINIRHTYTTYGDTAMDINIHKELKLIRNRAITAYALNGESFIVYNPAFEHLTINECYTLMSDGKKVYPRERAFVEQLPSSCADCGSLNHIKELVIVHPGLEPNCIVVLDYTLHRQSANYHEHIDMQQMYPVKQYDIIVNGETLRSEHNIPQNDFEPYAPKVRTYETDITLGVFPQYISETELPEADALLKKITTGDAVSDTKAICAWVRDNVNHHTGLDLSHLDYQLAPAADIFRSNCGTPADCVGLCVAMLNQAGIRAELIRDTTENDFSNSFLAEVTLGEMSYRINPLKSNTMKPKGAAIDVFDSIHIDTTIAWCGTEIADGYYTIELPKHHGSNALNPALLTPSRKAPVQVTPCDESYHYVVELPKKVKLMGDEVNISYKKEGVGSIEIKVIQKSKKLDITRHLTIDTPLIDEAHYADFRQLMTDWNSYQSFIVR